MMYNRVMGRNINQRLTVYNIEYTTHTHILYYNIRYSIIKMYS